MNYNCHNNKRTLPQNLIEEDYPLFAAELERTIPNCSVWRLTGVCLDEHGTFIYLGKNDIYGLNYQFFRSISKMAWIKRVISGRVKWIKKRVVFITDSWSYGYFHWLLESLPKLLLVDSKIDVTIAIPAHLADFNFVRESLSVLGFENILFLDTKKIYYFNELLVPDHGNEVGNYNDSLIRELRRFMTRNVTEKNADQLIFISRGKSSRRRISNEQQIDEVLKDFNIKKVFCEDLSFLDQIKLFASAEFIIGNHGAGLSNMLFMKSGASVLEIRRYGDTLNNCYFSLASALNLKYYYQLALPDAKAVDHHDDIFVDPVALRNTITQILNT